MNHGLSDKTIATIRSVLSKHPQIEQAILYGSRAKGNYRNGSDIDLVLAGTTLNLSQQFKIELELDELLLPYKIDLALLHKIQNPDLVEHISRVGVLFFEKSEGNSI
jgi:predicted nucleotidyltransferase